MKYREEHRDLFTVNYGLTGIGKGNFYCYAHCISADLGMFGGIAGEFNKRWDMKMVLMRKYQDEGLQKKFRKSKALVLPERVEDTFMNGNPGITFVYNLVTKELVEQKPTYDSLRETLIMTRDLMIFHGHKKLAIPKIGCGIDGLEWEIVSGIIKDVFKNTDIEILVCIR